MLAVHRSPELSEEADNAVVRRRSLRQADATALEARPDSSRRLHCSALSGSLRHLYYCSELTGLCVMYNLMVLI